MTKRRRKWRPWLKFPAWARRRLTYKRNVALHEHEAQVILNLIAERGCALQVRRHYPAVAANWERWEPGRWDRQYLNMALKRLANDKRLRDMIVVEGERREAA